MSARSEEESFCGRVFLTSVRLWYTIKDKFILRGFFVGFFFAMHLYSKHFFCIVYIYCKVLVNVFAKKQFFLFAFIERTCMLEERLLR